MTPEEFEKQIARILRALSENQVDVIWNDRFPDPDNPAQTRQVDISIRRGQHLTIVECRLHGRPQDVKWIEELYGRKVSLNADSVIGVSSSGFTKGAVEKARRLGVFLRSLSELSETEISTWGRRTKTKISYAKFSDVRLCIVLDDLAALPTEKDRSLRSENGLVHPISQALNNIVDHFSKSNAPEGPFTIQLFFDQTFMGSLPVREAVLSAEWQWVNLEVELPTVLSFKDSVETTDQPVIVEKDSHSRSEVHHRPNGAFALIDVSTALPCKCCFLREVQIVARKKRGDINGWFVGN